MCRREGRWWVALKANVDPEGAKGPDESVGTSGRLLAAGERFCLANGSLMQIVGYEGLAGPFAGPVGTHSLLGFGENIFRILMGVVRVVIRFLHLPDCRHDLGIDLWRFWLLRGLRFLPGLFNIAVFGHELVVGNLQVVAPGGLDLRLEFIEGGLGFIGDLPHSLLFQQPRPDSPLHAIRHDCPGIFDSGKFSHGKPRVQRIFGELSNDSSRRADQQTRASLQLIAGGAALSVSIYPSLLVRRSIGRTRQQRPSTTNARACPRSLVGYAERWLSYVCDWRFG